MVKKITLIISCGLLLLLGACGDTPEKAKKQLYIFQ